MVCRLGGEKPRDRGHELVGHIEIASSDSRDGAGDIPDGLVIIAGSTSEVNDVGGIFRLLRSELLACPVCQGVVGVQSRITGILQNLK